MVELGPTARGLEVGQRVVLNPWLTCGPRGRRPAVPGVPGGEPEPVLELHEGGARTGRARRGDHRRARGVGRAARRARLHAHPRARRACPTTSPCWPTPSPCRCTPSCTIRRRRGAGPSSTEPAPSAPPAWRACVRCTPTSRWPWWRGSPPRRRSPPGWGRPRSSATSPGSASSRSWRSGRAGSCTPRSTGCPWPTPGASTWSTTPSPSPRPSRSACASWPNAGSLVQTGVSTPGRWEWTPVYFKELTIAGSNAFAVEEIEGVRQHAIAHYFDLVTSGPRRPHGDAHPPIPAGTLVGRLERARPPGRERRHQGGVRAVDGRSMTTMPGAWDPPGREAQPAATR